MVSEKVVPFPLVGRASVAVRERDALREEVSALRAEMRDAAAVVPVARFVAQYVAADGVPLVTTAQQAVTAYLERIARRGGGA